MKVLGVAVLLILLIGTSLVLWPGMGHDDDTLKFDTPVYEDAPAAAAEGIVAECFDRVQPLDITAITAMQVEVLVQCAYEKAGRILGPLSQQVEDYLMSSNLLPDPNTE